jgi:hypothetical protein
VNISGRTAVITVDTHVDAHDDFVTGGESGHADRYQEFFRVNAERGPGRTKCFADERSALVAVEVDVAGFCGLHRVECAGIADANGDDIAVADAGLAGRLCFKDVVDVDGLDAHCFVVDLHLGEEDDAIGAIEVAWLQRLVCGGASAGIAGPALQQLSGCFKTFVRWSVVVGVRISGGEVQLEVSAVRARA